MIYVFGNCEFDTCLGALHRASRPVKLGRRVCGVFAYLIRHRHRAVPQDELLEQVWPQQLVSTWALARCISEARKAIGDDGHTQRVIKTLYGEGYRFIAAVEERIQEAPLDAVLPVPLTPRDAEADTPPGAAAAFYPIPPVQNQSPPQLDGARKQVTVLACALTNAAVLAEQRGTDALPRLLSAFFDLGLHEVRRYGGTTNQYLDDGFTALFGVPVAYEDHTQRALRAAIGLQQLLHEPWADRAPLAGEAPAVGIGLHTGLMVGERLGGERRMTYLAVGDTLRLATHLARHAKPGTILVSEATARLVRGEVGLTASDPLPMAGRAAPMPVFTVWRVRPPHALLAMRRARFLRRFVGRGRELALLQALLEQAVSGRGQVVGISGDPGIGKSRLLYEFRCSLHGKPVTYLEGSCLSHGRAIPYLPMRHLLRISCGITQTDGPQAVTGKVRHGLAELGIPPDDGTPYLLQLLGVRAETTGLTGHDPETIKARTFAILRQMILHGSQRRPLILVVENLHWIDRLSEALCASLIDRLTGVPLLLLVTYRPQYQPAWQAKSYVSHIALQPLTPQESLTLAHTARETGQIPEAVMQEMLAKAEGNPFFLEELLRAIWERGNFQAPLAIPPTIQDVLMAQIDQLPEGPRHLLQTASVLGREWPLRLLEAVWTGPQALDPLLLELQRLEFLYERPGSAGSVYRFKHALTQEVAYESLLPARRQTLHAAAGQALETLAGERLASH